MSVCDAVTLLGPCPFPPERTVTAMCVHEHIREGTLCADHLAAPDGADCRECWECAEPHRCPLTFADREEASRS